MNPQTAQNICQIFIWIFALLTASCWFGSYYFGKKVDESAKTENREFQEKHFNSAQLDREEKTEKLSAKLDKNQRLLEGIDEKISKVKRSLTIVFLNPKLSQFSDIKVYLHWQADDNETVLFKNNIYEYLTRAGWQVIQSAGHIADNSVQNVIIDLNSNLPDNSNIVLAAEKLKDILTKNNIKSRLFKNPNNNLTQNEMYLRISAIE